ncbi:MAG: beta-ketoacyl synthase chain length factor [Porticoccus sp.]|nr:beta-ketoacyl synthase chain length factor [Porticoccus sp.]MBQ0807577.1 beta-ketoacyl synthase chain length factor [Porticoccus sp.]
MAVSFSVSEWSGWRSGLPESYREDLVGLTVSEVPDVGAIPPILRRRLNMLGRACASEVLKHIPADTDIPIVYCSQHGDIERTLHVLESLVAKEAVSPVHFSLAVHNAICGVISIQAGNRASVSALSAGQQGLVPVLLEAIGMLVPGVNRVLCVICDVPLPEIYRDESSQPQVPYAVSFVVTSGDGIKLDLLQLAEGESMSNFRSPVDLIEFLGSDKSEFDLYHNGCMWRLARQ